MTPPLGNGEPMENFMQTDDQPHVPEDSPPQTRGWLKAGALMLVLGVVGSAGAFCYLNDSTKPPPEPLEFEQPDIGQATKNVEDAETKLAKAQADFQAAQKSLDEIQSEWESAKTTIEDAQAKLKSAKAEERADAQKTLEAAENRLTQLTKERDAAEAQLNRIGNQLKTDEQKKAEAEEKHKSIETELAKQETQRKELLGKWKSSADYGELELELQDEGKAVMTITFNTAAYFVVGSKKLEMDIEWKVASDDHLVFDSIQGRPQKAFHFVTVTLKRGTHRDQVLTSLKPESFSTYDVGKEDKIKTWTRIKPVTAEK